MSTSDAVPELLRAFVDDAAIFPPGNAPLDQAVRDHRTRRSSSPHAALVGTFVVDDRRLPDLDRAAAGGDAALPVSVVVAGGAGALDPAVRWASTPQLELAGLEIALRDSATGELAHNARRIVAAVDALLTDEGPTADGLSDEVPVYVEMPRLYGSPPTPDWFAALDELAAAELRLKLRTGGEDADAFPSLHELAGCIDAALDREMPFKCTAGLHHAVRHTDPATGFDHHGFLNVLVATRAALDGAGVDDVAGILAVRDGSTLTRDLDVDGLTSARRWFRSFGSCSIEEPIDDLRRLDLLEA